MTYAQKTRAKIATANDKLLDSEHLSPTNLFEHQVRLYCRYLTKQGYSREEIHNIVRNVGTMEIADYFTEEID
jgi:hypothetical protein